MAGPLAAVIGGLFTFYLAAVTSDGLVADDYYRRGLAINQVIGRSRNAARRGIRAEVNFDRANHSVRVELQGEVAPDSPPVLRLAHPTRAGGDRVVQLHSGNNGDYLGELRMPGRGRWHVILENAHWRVTGTWNYPEESSFGLAPDGDRDRPAGDQAQQGQR